MKSTQNKCLIFGIKSNHLSYRTFIPRSYSYVEILHVVMCSTPKLQNVAAVNCSVSSIGCCVKTVNLNSELPWRCIASSAPFCFPPSVKIRRLRVRTMAPCLTPIIFVFAALAPPAPLGSRPISEPQPRFTARTNVPHLTLH